MYHWININNVFVVIGLKMCDVLLTAYKKKSILVSSSFGVPALGV